MLSQLGTSCSPAPECLSPSNILIPAQTAKKRSSLISKAERKGSSRSCMPWQGVPAAALSLATTLPSPAAVTLLAMLVPTVQKSLPMSSRRPAHTKSARSCCSSWSPQKEGLLWWTSECLTRYANFPDLCFSRKLGLHGLSNPVHSRQRDDVP